MHDFAQISGSIESNINAKSLENLLRLRGVESFVDSNDLFIGGASNLRIEFDKGINTFRSDGGQHDMVLKQAKDLADLFSQSGINFFIEVCGDDWEQIIAFGDYGRN